MKELIEKCECGKIIKGTSESQMKHNIIIHKKSKGHKTAMKLNKKIAVGGDLQ